MTNPSPLSEHFAIELAKHHIGPQLKKSGRSFEVNAHRIEVGYWSVCFWPKPEDPDSVTTEHPVVVYVDDFGSARIAD